MFFTGVAYIMLYFSMDPCGSPLFCIHMQRSETFQRRIDTSVNNIENCRNRSKDHRRVRNQSIPGSGSRQHWALTTVDPSSGGQVTDRADDKYYYQTTIWWMFSVLHLGPMILGPTPEAGRPGGSAAGLQEGMSGACVVCSLGSISITVN